MHSPGSPALQQLLHLDASSPGFPDELINVLLGQEYRQHSSKFESDDARWLADYLDKTLDCLDPSSRAARKCLRELRSVCGNNATLPASYAIQSGLLEVGRDPFTSGGYCDVYLGTLGGSNVFVKRVRIYASEGPEKVTRTFCKEAVMWKRLAHPNIVPLLGVTITPLQLVSGRMPGGTLPQYIKKQPDADRLVFLSDVSKGLHYLHSCDAIHGDLKGSNVHVDDSGHARIADFGLATVTKDLGAAHNTTFDVGIIPRWTAPEVLNGGPCTKAADVFSFGMLMIEVFTGDVPFSAGSSLMAVLAIMEGKRPQRPTHPNVTENMWKLIQHCWQQDPRLRPDAVEVSQTLLTLDPPAWRRLISDNLSADERISLLTFIFSDPNEVDMVRSLSKENAQAFVDVIDETLDSLPHRIHKRCSRYLSGICGRKAVLPKSLRLPLCYDPAEAPRCHGAFSDIWKGKYLGGDVAAKVLRVSSKCDLEQLERRFCREAVTWSKLSHPNVLTLLGVTMTENRFVMVSQWTDNGDIKEFLRRNTNANRLELLKDATKGLIYMHSRGVVHGGLKGTSIMIRNDGHACLTESGLISMITNQPAFISSCVDGGTMPWMSPELLNPNSVGLTQSRPTKESDCHAMGMVIYEILSGRVPFAPHKLPVLKIIRGERPERPRGTEGALFTDGIWETLELCWKVQAKDRVNAKGVLRGLEGDSDPLQTPGNVDDAEEDQDSDFYQSDT